MRRIFSGFDGEEDGVARATALAGQWVLLVAAFLTVLLTARMLYDGHIWLNRGIDGLRSGDVPAKTVSAFENAARSFVPGSPYPSRALWHLSIMARSAAMGGDVNESLFIWEVIRRSVLATRHMIQPNQDFLQDAERQIIRLRSRLVDREAVNGKPEDTIRRPDDPIGILSLILFAGLCLWIAGAIGLCLVQRGTGRKTRRRLWILTLLGLAVWIALSGLA